jgi:ATP-dependent RNA helicase DeaD
MFDVEKRIKELEEENKSLKVKAIMLAPTRELALQITAELTKMKHSPEEFKIVTVYGGVGVQD